MEANSFRLAILTQGRLHHCKDKANMLYAQITL